ncbi:hypothetical protein EYF80_029400 [Liparis tanakae]|uniref:Uncharacterized protein n=1 Tax=Liparis tanakae TaxID=230148 RepID=A0A4Z2H472_9TELE|nr:hypothetical protein EYF80_029400 [Liparis tanakae]
MYLWRCHEACLPSFTDSTVVFAKPAMSPPANTQGSLVCMVSVFTSGVPQREEPRLRNQRRCRQPPKRSLSLLSPAEKSDTDTYLDGASRRDTVIATGNVSEIDRSIAIDGLATTGRSEALSGTALSKRSAPSGDTYNDVAGWLQPAGLMFDTCALVSLQRQQQPKTKMATTRKPNSRLQNANLQSTG